MILRLLLLFIIIRIKRIIENKKKINVYNNKYRKEIDKEKERFNDSCEIEDDTFWYFSSQWDVLNSSFQANEE